jgi:chemotaxis-related protein WspD
VGDAPTPSQVGIGRDASGAADRLLEREAPRDYLEAWARVLSAPPSTDASALRAGLLFRLGDERFVLDSSVVREVHVAKRVHRVPGRTNDLFRGLVSLRGEIHLCGDLHALLGCPRSEASASSTARMLVVERKAERWALEADQVLDVRRFADADVAPPQVTVEKAAVRFTDGVVRLEDGPAARLDPERLFTSLARVLS